MVIRSNRPIRFILRSKVSLFLIISILIMLCEYLIALIMIFPQMQFTSLKLVLMVCLLILKINSIIGHKRMHQWISMFQYQSCLPRYGDFHDRYETWNRLIFIMVTPHSGRTTSLCLNDPWLRRHNWNEPYIDDVYKAARLWHYITCPLKHVDDKVVKEITIHHITVFHFAIWYHFN